MSEPMFEPNKMTLVETLNDDLKNEWKHLRFYLYHASAVVGLHREEFREFLLKQAASEMSHVTQFSDMILGLESILLNRWRATSESNEFEKYTKINDILSYALRMEEEVVDNYARRLFDLQNGKYEFLSLSDKTWLELFFEGQIEHSREDVDNLKQILKGI